MLKVLFFFFTYMPAMAWVWWLYAAVQAKHLRYLVYACLYFVPFLLGGFGNFGAIVAIGAWIGGIIHSQMTKNEVDLRIYYARVRADKEVQKRVATEYGVPVWDAEPPSIRPESATPTLLKQPSSAPPRPHSVPPRISTVTSGVDVNNAGEDEIGALPGIGPILAKKAIQFRHTQGGFQSAEHFAQVLGLKPYAFERIRPLVVIVPGSVKIQGVVKKTSTRIVDV